MSAGAMAFVAYSPNADTSEFWAESERSSSGLPVGSVVDGTSMTQAGTNQSGTSFLDLSPKAL
jgi:hypothetical protein